MGFLNKLKQASNFITGGGAKLQVQQLNQVVSEGNIQLKVKCQISDADISVSNIYLKVRSVERVVVEDYDFDSEDGKTRRETIYRDNDIYQERLIIDNAQTLEANSNHEWNVEVPIPENAYGTYKGKHAVHVWEVFAGLDKSGNDPDSGWIEIEVYN